MERNNHPFAAEALDALKLAVIEALYGSPTVSISTEELLAMAQSVGRVLPHWRIGQVLALVDHYAEMHELGFEEALRALHVAAQGLWVVMHNYQSLCNQFGANSADDKIGGTSEFYAYVIQSGQEEPNAQRYVRWLHAERCSLTHG